MVSEPLQTLSKMDTLFLEAVPSSSLLIWSWWSSRILSRNDLNWVFKPSLMRFWSFQRHWPQTLASIYKILWSLFWLVSSSFCLDLCIDSKTQKCWYRHVQGEHRQGHRVGLDLYTGEPFDPETEGIWDNYRVKRQMLQSASVITTQLLLVDEMIKAGKSQGKIPEQ